MILFGDLFFCPTNSSKIIILLLQSSLFSPANSLFVEQFFPMYFFFVSHQTVSPHYDSRIVGRFCLFIGVHQELMWENIRTMLISFTRVSLRESAYDECINEGWPCLTICLSFGASCKNAAIEIELRLLCSNYLKMCVCVCRCVCGMRVNVKIHLFCNTWAWPYVWISSKKLFDTKS